MCTAGTFATAHLPRPRHSFLGCPLPSLAQQWEHRNPNCHSNSSCFNMILLFLFLKNNTSLQIHVQLCFLLQGKMCPLWKRRGYKQAKTKTEKVSKSTPTGSDSPPGAHVSLLMHVPVLNASSKDWGLFCSEGTLFPLYL